MAKCPECGAILAVPTSIHILNSVGRRQPLEPLGAWCRSGLCDYGAISEDEPDIPHPLLARMRYTKEENQKFRKYASAISILIPETEIDPGRCAGRPVFTNSRLPVEIILSQVSFGETDQAILQGYPRMNLFLLKVIRSLMAANPAPPVSEIKI